MIVEMLHWLDILLVIGLLGWMACFVFISDCFDKQKKANKYIIALFFLFTIPTTLMTIGLTYFLLQAVFGGMAYKSVFLGISTNTEFWLAWIAILASIVVNFSVTYMIYYENKYELWRNEP